MTTRALADFLPFVLPHATGVPIPVAEQFLRLAATEWCERTRCWRHISTTNVLTGGDGTVVAPAYATIHEFESAYLDGEELTPTQYSEFSPEDLDKTITTGAPRYITQTEPGIVSIIPFQEGTLTVTAFLKPRGGIDYGTTVESPVIPQQDTFNVVPEHIFVQSAENIAEGALARLLMIKDKPWSDPKMALYYRARFDEAMNRSFAKGIQGQQKAPVRSKADFL